MPSLRKPKMRGIKAPPPNEATTRDDPTLVKRPRSVIASGQMAGFIREHASAMKATHQMETFGGGALIPLIFGFLKDGIGNQAAYWICLPCYLFIFYYAYIGYKIRK